MSEYNGSNRFTATATGIYVIGAAVNVQASPSTAGSAQVAGFFKKNGLPLNGGFSDASVIVSGSVNGVDSTLTMTSLISLSANDFIEVFALITGTGGSVTGIVDGAKFFAYRIA